MNFFNECSCRPSKGGNHNNPRTELSFVNEEVLNSLSDVEKNQIACELYGTDDYEIEETDEFLTAKVNELKELLCNAHETSNSNHLYLAQRAIPTKVKQTYFEALDEECKQGTEYVRSKKFLLMFLRSELFDTHKAALRLCRYFDEKKELFGSSKLCHRIRQSDLNQHDMEALMSGFLYIGDGIDHAGRVGFVITRQCAHFRDVINIRRAYFYLLSSTAEDDLNEVQKRGMVTIIYEVGKKRDFPAYPGGDYKYFIAMKRLVFQAMPIRDASVHYCNTTLERLVISTFLLAAPKSIKARFKQHFGPSHMKCRAQLLTYGIHVYLLPINNHGEFDYYMLHASMKKKRLKEEKDFQKLSGSYNSSSNESADNETNVDDLSSLGSY